MFQKGDEFNTKRNRISTSREKQNTENSLKELFQTKYSILCHK